MPFDQTSSIIAWISQETGITERQVTNVIVLLSEGGTVPFIARYRKERTGELDETAIRTIEERHSYFRELLERKHTILKSIDEQGKLTPELEQLIQATRQKNELEDLYLPFRPKRRTKATIAIERGLGPLADLIAAQAMMQGNLEEIAAPFVDSEREVPDSASAVAGAGHILAERYAEQADIRAFVRDLTWQEGVLRSRVAPEKKTTVTKFEMYYDYSEPLRLVPSHRILAMRRGEKEEVLYLDVMAPVDTILDGIRGKIIIRESIFRPFLGEVAADAYKRLIAPAIETELRLQARDHAEETAISIFSQNLRNVLLAAPAGEKPVLGIDPGFRTGCKIAAVDGTGRFLAHVTIYPHSGDKGRTAARSALLEALQQHRSELIAIGNGTAGRETEEFVRETLRAAGLEIPVVMVNEAGASVYSASDIAREEFPDLDLTVRGAISIARRLQDPLAELVKIDPKSIGVGQYQHDVQQARLKKSLDAVVESCVNYVGVDLNTASWALLSYVAGIGESLAKAIVKHRDDNGPFRSRQKLMNVPRFGSKAFEQAAGFLRIRGGDHPLDATAVHPERYSLVERMAQDLGLSLLRLVAEPASADNLDLSRYVAAEVGLPTLRDILHELKKPGRDPRAEFIPPSFRKDVNEIADLEEGMVLEGVVTNVTAFGAFVDVGVHQDGLVHVSQLADRFVKDPAQVVHAGQKVRVKILSVDIERRRMALSMRHSGEGS